MQDTRPTIVFDLDGTLVDSAPDLIDTLNVILRAEGISPLAFETARPLIGHGVRVLLERSFETIRRPCPPDDLERMFKAYLDHYSGRIAQLTRPFPGLEPALDTLTARGCVLAVCTNKLEWLSRKLLDTLGLTSRFAAICGQDTFGMPKPDPEILRRTIVAAGGDPAFAVMVGDSVTDIRTAQAAQIPVVLTDFGYPDHIEAGLPPDRIIRHFDALPEAVFALLAGARTPVLAR